MKMPVAKQEKDIMVNLVNCTPHKVVIVRDDGIAVTLRPSGRVIRVDAEQEVIGEVNGITVVESRVNNVVGLPYPCDNCERKGVDCDTVLMDMWCSQQKPRQYYIVSSMVTMLLPERKDLLSPDTGPTAIRDTDGEVIAVRRLQRWKRP